MKLSSLLIIIAAAGQSHAWSPGRPATSLGSKVTSNVNDGIKRHNAKKVALSSPLSVRGGTALDMAPASSLVTTLVPRIGILTNTNESLDDLNPVPLAIMAVSSLCWLVYGLSVRDPFVTLSNVPGSIASIWYVMTVLPLLKGAQLQTTQNIVVGLSAVTINLWTWLALTNKSLEQVSSALGLFASGLFIVLSGSPLSTIKTVLSTKNSKSILTQMTFAQIINTALWSAYGLAIKDKFVYGPNMTGLGFGLIQLALKLVFPSK
ncbi:SWEET family sugar transporter [Skeletonema marinoi]|uniref:Sugar transporter SWEET1 n=1 Tax=Skeletonema marinoi TaxID=267567 RepID=A0AAD8YQD0_9STRA|nr:SWEET family sugar transporter [Skeletonema marinoi]